MHLTNAKWRALPTLVVLLICGLTAGKSFAQAVDIPTTRTRAIVQQVAVQDEGATLGGVTSTKNVVEQQQQAPFWTWYTEVGYTSEYIFRGTNLTPDSDGDGFITAQVTKDNWTLGIAGYHQFGTARSPSFSIGEGGGGAGGAFPGKTVIFSSFVPETVQTRFNELDAYLQHKWQLGMFDVVLGDISFFIDRRATTFITFTPGIFGPAPETYPFPTVQNEWYNRLFLSLAAPRLLPANSALQIIPKITYYQTIMNEGEDPLAKIGLPERLNDAGGYLEGRVTVEYKPSEWWMIRTYGQASCSFKDRAKGGAADPDNFVKARPLTGMNNVQAHVEIPITLLRYPQYPSTGSAQYAPPEPELSFVPFGDYSYHISEPTPGTDRNEFWGGAKFTLLF